MTKDFKTQIDRFVVDTEHKLMKVTRFALEDLTRDANTPKAKGGRLPVKTGFLRSTASAAVNQRPIGPTKGEKNRTYTTDANQVTQALLQLKFGNIFYYGWTAEYARVQEVRNGFLEGAIMKWQSFVDKAVGKLR